MPTKPVPPARPAGRRFRAAEILKVEIPIRWESLKKSRPEWVADFETQTYKLMKIAADYENGRTATLKDPDLSPEGKSRKIARLGEETLAAGLKFERDIVEPLKARVGQLRVSLVVPPFPRPTDPGERIAHELRLREIRDELRVLDPLERVVLYEATSDLLVLEAVETAPPVLVRGPGKFPALLPFVEPARVEARRLARAKEAQPEQALLVEDLELLASAYTSLLAEVDATVVDDVPEARDSAPIPV